MQDYIDMISNNLKYILKTEDENSITFLVESKVECLVCIVDKFQQDVILNIRII